MLLARVHLLPRLSRDHVLALQRLRQLLVRIVHLGRTAPAHCCGRAAHTGTACHAIQACLQHLLEVWSTPGGVRLQAFLDRFFPAFCLSGEHNLRQCSRVSERLRLLVQQGRVTQRACLHSVRPDRHVGHAKVLDELSGCQDPDVHSVRDDLASLIQVERPAKVFLGCSDPTVLSSSLRDVVNDSTASRGRPLQDSFLSSRQPVRHG